MSIEIELKFRAPQRRLQTLRNWKIPGSTVGERSENDLRLTYFDTPGLELKRRGRERTCRQADSTKNHRDAGRTAAQKPTTD
jgi:inorganic triphosphatase YgiF